MYWKNNEYKSKIKLLCVLYKKHCSGTAHIEFRKFFNDQEHNHPKSFAEIEKTKIEARIPNESETSTPAQGDISNNNSNPENVDISTFRKTLSIMRKKRANNAPRIPCKVEDFDNLLKNPDFRTIDGNIFYRTFTSNNDEIALKFLAENDLSFLNRIHVIQVDATFKTVPVEFLRLLIIQCFVQDTIITVVLADTHWPLG